MEMTRRAAIGAAALAGFSSSMASLGFGAASIRVGGTGSTTAFMNQLGKAWQGATGHPAFSYLSGLGSGGAIQAARDKVLDLAISARRLGDDEKRDLVETPFSSSPFVFATSHPNAGAHTIDGIAAMYARPAPRWPDETPVRIIIRPRHESDTKLIAAHFPVVAQAIEQARTRPDVPVAATDIDNAQLGERISG